MITALTRATPMGRDNLMATKRLAFRATDSSATPASTPWGTALLLGVALCTGLGTLVSRGRLQWPPTQLVASLYTMAGCLALIGPILLHRKGAGEVGLGELI